MRVLLRVPILNGNHWPPISGNTCKQSKYDTMRKEFFWPHKSNDVHQTVESCATCVHVGESLQLERHLRIITAFGTTCTYRSGQTRRTAPSQKRKEFFHSNYVELLMLTWVMQTWKKTATHTATFFVEYLIVSCGAPSVLLMDGSPQFGSTCLPRFAHFLQWDTWRPRLIVFRPAHNLRDISKRMSLANHIMYPNTRISELASSDSTADVCERHSGASIHPAVPVQSRASALSTCSGNTHFSIGGTIGSTRKCVSPHSANPSAGEPDPHYKYTDSELPAA